MNDDSFYRQAKSCRRMPACRRFAWQGNTDAFASAHDACIWPNDFGIDDLNEVLCSPISRIDRVDRKTIHQIPIACTLI